MPKTVAIAVTQGGVVQPGETAGPAAGVRTMRVVANPGGEWLLVSYHVSPLVRLT